MMAKHNGFVYKPSVTDIRKLLLDREWHFLHELAGSMRGRIPPEQATRSFREGRQNRTDIIEGVPDEVQVTLGVERIISSIISSETGRGSMERQGAKGSHGQVRISCWFCWSCGTRVDRSPERPKHGLCEECRVVIEGKDESK